MKLEVSLTKHLGDFSFDTDFCVDGERIGIFGPSGSGKSTLSNLLTGFLTADRGLIQLDRRKLFDSDAKINLSPDHRRVAVVFQHAHLFPHLNVRKNLLYGHKRTPASQRQLELADVTKALNIDHLLKRNVTQLSGGEKQRVALGRALLACPDLLVLDEPLSALDKQLKEQIIPFLRTTLRHFAIPYLYISHSLSEMRLLTDQVMQFADGRLQQITNADTLERERMAGNRHGYLNHLTLSDPHEVDNLISYRWGANELFLTANERLQDGLFGLSSKDILLCKKHPHAMSARNLLTGTITGIMPHKGAVGVELNCNGEILLAQVVSQAVAELELDIGKTVYAAFKASAFRRLT
ncbi:molybdate transport system ATP-binding protein [Desulfuromusa kysingii]|uniref:Molybdate transport system ATP-binding protein n=1 Tax=Desulfuromusa kysingii TaxID=37625 RepID=A0A1H4DI83_9BACT|nr:molybdenum ABC transporter ATP-binding protein [Desulfuromusa kysingii]SEA72475.1 molybdate transport system ATP-binding protein [Desulfuromusa kysingii]